MVSALKFSDFLAQSRDLSAQGGNRRFEFFSSWLFAGHVTMLAHTERISLHLMSEQTRLHGAVIGLVEFARKKSRGPGLRQIFPSGNDANAIGCSRKLRNVHSRWQDFGDAVVLVVRLVGPRMNTAVAHHGTSFRESLVSR